MTDTDNVYDLAFLANTTVQDKSLLKNLQQTA